MAMNASTMANLIDAKAQALQPLPAEARAGRKKMFQAVSEAVVEHIKAAMAIKHPSGLASIPGTAGGPLVPAPGATHAFLPGSVE